MKKNVIDGILYVVFGILICIFFACMIFSGCSNRQIVDTTNRFTRAIIVMNDGSRIEGKVQSWLDFKDSDDIQIKIDGVTYYTSSENVLLIAD